MRYYIVVEGKCGERIVYPQWINYINKKLTQIDDITNNIDNAFFLISGNGYPQYYKIIDNAIEDVNSNRNFDYLVVAVDAEEFTYHEKLDDIAQYIGERLLCAKLKIIIQYPCLETWALGNRVVFRRNPENEKLREYLKIYNVRTQDPELLPNLPSESLNRAQFAFTYLKCILADRYPKLIYTKSNPKILVHEKYFEQIRKRYCETSDIRSFRSFLEAFV